MIKKSLPVGIDDFKKIIEKNYYFVDKSILIDEVLNKRSEVTLLSRPRRFAKNIWWNRKFKVWYNIRKI